jgi:dTDP-4-amino-4,6-dideoxygalactose transaminase
MLGLIPTEHWEHTFNDLLRSMVTAVGTKEQNGMLNIPGLGDCIPVRSGRAGLVAAIKALNLVTGARIGVPLYCCPVVFEAIRTAGCKPSFIDVEPGSYCLSAKDLYTKGSQLDAVIAVHMFGNMCDMRALHEAARGKPIIEDCAQAIGSKLEGRMAGSFGTIAFFSFRSGKYLSAGEGGAVFSSQEEIRTRLSELIGAASVPSSKDECAHAAKTYIRSMLRSKPLYGVVGYTLWKVYSEQFAYSAKSPIVVSQIYRTDLALTKNRIAVLDSAIEAQRANAEVYSRTLNLDGSMLCAERPGTYLNRYLYPITFPSSEHRDLIAAHLHNRQIGTIKPYKDIVEIATTHYGYSGGCPAAEQASGRILAIPNNYSLRKDEVQRIAECVNASWAEVRRRGHD